MLALLKSKSRVITTNMKKDSYQITKTSKEYPCIILKLAQNRSNFWKTVIHSVLEEQERILIQNIRYKA